MREKAFARRAGMLSSALVQCLFCLDKVAMGPLSDLEPVRLLRAFEQATWSGPGMGYEPSVLAGTFYREKLMCVCTPA